MPYAIFSTSRGVPACSANYFPLWRNSPRKKTGKKNQGIPLQRIWQLWAKQLLREHHGRQRVVC